MGVSLRQDPGLWLMLHLRPPSDRKGDRSGHCTVCGRSARFVRNRWVLPTELARSWPPGFVDRESLLCDECGSSWRVRRIATVLLALYGKGHTSVAELVQDDAFRALRIAEINSIGRMHPFLARLPRLTSVEYPEEDVMALSYADASFDLVLTSDTLEHVPDPMRGLREIRRVLRPGGRHIFTVPVDPRIAVSRSREGSPPEYHGRGGGPFALVTRRADMLAYTDFGPDVCEWLDRADFRCDVHGAGVDAVFVSTAR